MQEKFSVKTIYWLAPALAVLMFIGACILPSLTFTYTKAGPGTLTWTGFACIFYTLLGPLMCQFEGLANLAILGSALAMALRFPKAALILALLGTLPALQTFSLFHSEIYLDEGGVNRAILTRLEPGFFVWMGSLLVLILGSATCILKEKSTLRTSPTDDSSATPV